MLCTFITSVSSRNDDGLRASGNFSGVTSTRKLFSIIGSPFSSFTVDSMINLSVTKDTTGKWMSQVRVKDYTGKTIHKKKRRFSTKKEALEWERYFLKKATADTGMLFEDFVDLYFEDMGHRIKESTLISKHYMIDKKILPVFGKMPLSSITANDIRKWQNQLTSSCSNKGKPYSPTYLNSINNQMTAMFNYAVKYYNLDDNPCKKAGSMGKSNAEEMHFWTKAEFEQFITAVQDKAPSYTTFMTLYYTGMRVGELCALTPADIDLVNNTININKTFQRINGRDVIWPPKTPKSNRIVTIPQTLADCLKDYIKKCYEIQPNDRLFPYTKSFFNHEMLRGCKKSGVKKIRVHDLRHSHASLLIEMGCQPLLIADRLGHEKIQTTLNTYSHLYPNKQSEVAAQLESIINGTTVPNSSQMASVANL